MKWLLLLAHFDAAGGASTGIPWSGEGLKIFCGLLQNVRLSAGCYTCLLIATLMGITLQKGSMDFKHVI